MHNNAYSYYLFPENGCLADDAPSEQYNVNIYVALDSNSGGLGNMLLGNHGNYQHYLPSIRKCLLLLPYLEPKNAKFTMATGAHR